MNSSYTYIWRRDFTIKWYSTKDEIRSRFAKQGNIPVKLVYMCKELKEDCAYEDLETGGLLRLSCNGWELRLYKGWGCMLAELEKTTAGPLPTIYVTRYKNSNVTVTTTMKTVDVQGVFSGKSRTTIKTIRSLERFQALVRGCQVRRRWEGHDIELNEPD